MMQHCIASQHALAMSFIAIFFFSQITCCNATPEAAQEDPQLDHRKQKLLETGYVYAGNINSPYPEGNMCNHTACDWDPLSGHVDPEHMKDSPIVSQAVLLDGSRYVRKEARLLNTALQEAMEVPVSHTTNIAKMNRKLLEIWGPYDPELQMRGKDRAQVTNGHYPFSAIGQFDSGCTGTLIGPCHVLTAGHCLYHPKRNKWLQRPGFTPGRTGSGGWAPHGKAKVRSMNVMIGWQLLSNYSADIGLAVLDWRVGDRTGTLDFGPGNLEEPVSLNMAGYPDDKGNGEMWYDFCYGSQFEYSIGKVVHHKCTSDNGNSGSPLWVYKKWGNFRQIQGVHTGVFGGVSVALTNSGGVGGNVQPYGAVLSAEKTKIIRKWINDNQCY